MKISSQVPEGYKQTEVGVIPEDWKVSTLGQHASFKTGPFGSLLHKSDYINSGVPIVNPMQINNGKIEPTSSMSVTKEAAKKLFNFHLHSGDIVIGRRGEMGRCAYVTAEQEGWLCGSGSMIVRVFSGTDAQFIQRFLSSPVTVNAIESASVGITMINLNQKSLSNLLISLPPTEAEQSMIASTLSDIDNLLASLDRLIAKKRDLKQATMQQLLKGKKRLKGFDNNGGCQQTEIGLVPGDWNVCKIKDIVEGQCLPSGIYKEKSLYGKGNPIIKIGDVFNLDYFVPDQSKRVPLSADEISNYQVKIGDIFIALASVKLEGVGKVMLVTELSEDTAYDHNVALIRVNGSTDSKFIFYMLKSNLVRDKIAQVATQVGTTFLKASVILSFQIPIPKEEEQKAIAQVLTDMDTELTTLEQRRHKTRNLKQAMMQELLTGRIRLKIET